MASGYETRTGGRDTFASQGPGIVQLAPRGSSISGDSRGVQRVGGDAAAGGVPNAGVTAPGPMADGLGEFFTKALKPYVERKQQERFFEGFTRAQSGEALEDLNKSGKGVAGALFGPNSLAQGAEFYTAMKSVNDWQTSMTERMDELKQMDPDSLSKELAKSSQAMMSKDPYVNMMVQQALIKKAGPMVDTITKARMGWIQDNAENAMFNGLNSAATSYQSSAVAQAKVNDPNDPGNASLAALTDDFKGMMQKPPGMTDDTYRTTLKKSMVSFLQNKNFYAYQAMVDAGVMNVLDDDGQKAVTAAYDQYKGHALEDAKGDHIEEMQRVYEAQQRTALGLSGGMTPLQAIAAVDNINASISRETGIRERAYDSSFLNQTGKTVIDMIATAARRKQELADTEGLKLKNKEEQLGAANTAFGMGQSRAYLTADGDKGSLDQVYWQQYEKGNLKGLVANYVTDHYTDDNVGQRMQAKITSGNGENWTGEVEQGYKEWQAMYNGNNAAALSYYGPDVHGRMLKMNDLIQAGTPKVAAYQTAFGDLANSNADQTLAPDKRKEIQTGLQAQIKSNGDAWFTRWFPKTAGWFGGHPMTEYSQNVLTDAATLMTANMQRTSHQSVANLSESAYRAAVTNHSAEYYGGNLAWRQKAGTQTVADYLKLSEDRTGAVLYKEIDERLRQVGNASGANSDYQILRSPAGKDGFVLTVLPQNGVPINITGPELRHRADELAKKQMEVHTEMHGQAYKHVQGPDADRPEYHQQGWLMKWITGSK
jgi:hypothetical protein